MRVAELRPSLSDTYYNIALAYHRMEQSADADRYFNRYQDMLSLRKAKELARKKAEMKQQEQPAVAADTKPVKAKSPKAVAKKPVVKKMNPTWPPLKKLLPSSNSRTLREKGPAAFRTGNESGLS